MSKVSKNSTQSIANDLPIKRRRGLAKPELILQLSEEGNYQDILKILEDMQTDIRDLQIRMENTDTALHLAAGRGHTKAVSVLMETVINVHITGHLKRTPLHCSAENGHLVVTKRLLDAGARVDVKDAHGATALHLAEKNMHAEVVLLLARKGAKITDNTIRMAISTGNKELVHLCLQKRESYGTVKFKSEFVVMAAWKEKWEIVTSLLNTGVEALTWERQSALVYAANAGEADIVRQLLEHGAKSDYQQIQNALKVAANRSVVHVFLNVVPDVVLGETGNAAVLAAATEGRHETLGALCDAGIDVNVRDLSDQPALYLATIHGHYSCVTELIDRGVDVNAKKKWGKSSLDEAVKRGFKEIETALLRAGAFPKKERVSTSFAVASTQELNRTST